MSSRIVLIGAGSAQFGFDMLGDVFQSAVLEGSHVVLHDINGEALERVQKAGDAFIAEHGLSVTLSATTSREEALAGADRCVELQPEEMSVWATRAEYLTFKPGSCDQVRNDLEKVRELDMDEVKAEVEKQQAVAAEA